jgi:putative hydrolase of the HAD superfamily
VSFSAVSFDYWDTLYVGARSRERMQLTQGALRRLLDDIGRPVPTEEFDALYRASAAEAERWWREERRGYTARDRIGWILTQLDMERPEDCEHVGRAVQAVDDALRAHPAPLLPGAANLLRELAELNVPLAITSDTGFASGVAQDALLARDQLQDLFAVRVYSCDVGHAKPHPEPFRRLVAALGVAPERVVHVGDNEHTDVRGALDAGLRAVRLDVVRAGGPSDAEFVATSLDELGDYLRSEWGA